MNIINSSSGFSRISETVFDELPWPIIVHGRDNHCHSLLCYFYYLVRTTNVKESKPLPKRTLTKIPVLSIYVLRSIPMNTCMGYTHVGRTMICNEYYSSKYCMAYFIQRSLRYLHVLYEWFRLIVRVWVYMCLVSSKLKLMIYCHLIFCGRLHIFIYEHEKMGLSCISKFIQKNRWMQTNWIGSLSRCNVHKTRFRLRKRRLFHGIPESDECSAHIALSSHIALHMLN